MAELPRNIWVMWLQGLEAAPEGIQRCIRSWMSQNPGWTVTFLSEENLTDWVDAELLDDRRLDWTTPTLRSDLIRLNLLARFGGVWADASTWCHAPLDAWLESRVNPAGFFAFSWLDQPATSLTWRKRDSSALISSWFLAATTGHELIQRLYRALYAYLTEYDFSKAKDLHHRALHLLAETVLTRNEWLTQWYISPYVARTFGIFPYFALHFHFNQLVLRDRRCREIWDAMPKVDARASFVPDRLGLGTPVTRSIAQELQACEAPVFKLRWRVPCEPGSVFDAVTSLEPRETT